MRLSLIIPAFNEESKIVRDLEETLSFLSKQAFRSEVLIVNDGSRDQTTRRVQEYIKTRKPAGKVKLRLLDYEKNRGKGYAIRYGMARAQGDNIAFMDSGLCVPLKFLIPGMVKLDEGYDYAIASRRLPETRIVQSQPLYRRVGSQVFWLVIKLAMGVRVSDTQCGFKIFSARAAKQIFSRIATDGYMFDIECLIIAEKLGLKGAEFPIEWTNDSDTRYHPVWGTLRNFKELSRIRLRWLGVTP